MTLEFTPPVLITYGGGGSSAYCLQPSSVSADAPVLLQKIDFSGQTLAQFWRFGNDLRIYSAATASGEPLLCLDVNQTDSRVVLQPAVEPDNNQAWDGNTYPPTLISVGGSTDQNRMALDLYNGDTTPGNYVQLYAFQGTTHSPQLWVPTLLPDAYLTNVPQPRSAAAGHAL